MTNANVIAELSRI